MRVLFICKQWIDTYGKCYGLINSASFLANMLNDYADSGSGADAQDPRYFGFFGGTKLIQDKVFSEKFFLAAGVVLIALSLITLLALSLAMKSFSALG